MDHAEVAQTIIESEKDVMGQVAVMKASQLEFIDDGEVSQDIGREEVEELLRVFRDLQGQGALGIARKGLDKEKLEESDLDLPVELLE